MSDSAATALVRIAERDHRFVRDELTGHVYAVPREGGGEPLLLALLVDSLAATYYREQGKVAASAAKRDALAVLQAVEVEGVEQIIRPPEPPSEEEVRERLAQLEVECRPLLDDPGILARLDRELRATGFQGDTLAPRLVYLACCSTLLEVGRTELVERLVSVKVDGPTAAGKNYAIDAALDFLPEEFPMVMSAMSERALIYDTSPLERRALYFPEGAALRDDGLGAVILRTLLSENRIRYPVVITTDGGVPETVVVERDGPALALISTSAIRLDRDLETRLLRIRIDDSEELTAEIIRGHGERAALGGREPQLRPEWHAYYSWLRLQGPYRVRVPFGVELAELIPAGAVRLRRDVGLVFTLIATHAVLNLARREIDASGMVLAELEDYEAVYGLVDAVLGQGVGSSVPAWARETYDVLPEDGEGNGVNYSALGRLLGIGPDAARDRALKLQELGYVINRETREHVPARLVRGDPVPEGEGFLPALAALRAALAGVGRGETHPNTRNAADSPMGTTFEVRVEPPEPQPATRTVQEPLFGEVRVSGSPSGTPTRNPEPHEKAENGLPSGVRVDSHPPERECLVCGAGYPEDERHPERLRCAECLAGVAA